MNATDSVQALIYLPHASRSVSRVREFRRCPEHDNLLAWEGRAVGVDEFNTVAPKALGSNAVATYGMQPLVKLVRIKVEAPEPEAEGGETKPLIVEKPEPVIQHIQVGVEPIADGFMLVNYSSPEAQYMGTGGAWETDASLVTPFATEKAARSACPGQLVEKPAAVKEETAPLPPEDPPQDPGENDVSDSDGQAAPAEAIQPPGAKKRGRKPKAPAPAE